MRPVVAVIGHVLIGGFEIGWGSCWSCFYVQEFSKSVMDPNGVSDPKMGPK